MNDNMNMIYETLKELIDEQRKQESNSKRKEPSYIYLDEKDNQIKEIPLSKLDSAGSAYIKRTMNYKYKSPAKLIRDSLNID